MCPKEHQQKAASSLKSTRSTLTLRRGLEKKGFTRVKMITSIVRLNVATRERF
jgi:hypothetical protein